MTERAPARAQLKSIFHRRGVFVRAAINPLGTLVRASPSKRDKRLELDIYGKAMALGFDPLKHMQGHYLSINLRNPAMVNQRLLLHGDQQLNLPSQTHMPIERERRAAEREFNQQPISIALAHHYVPSEPYTLIIA
jgi:hypothetical protein